MVERLKGGKAVIAGSGMMTGGRILSYAKKYLNQKNTTLLLVGYQGAETLGRELKEGAKFVFIDDKKIAVQAKVSSIESLSSHADEPRLTDWLSTIKDVKTVFLTHGEDEARVALASKIKKETGVGEIRLPELDEEVILD